MRFIAALGAVFFAAIGIAACGGGIPGNAVVQVAGTPVSKSTFDHWMKAAAASSAGATGVTKPVVPDPPTYEACVKHLRETLPKPAKGQPKQTEAQLKTQCEQQYTALKERTLSFLISASWLIGQAEEMKVSIPDKKVEKELAKLKKQRFKNEAEYKKLLANTDQTTSDLLLSVKLNMLSTKIQEKVTKEAKKKVSKAEAQKYYNEHKSSYGQPEKRNLRIILTKTEAQASAAKSEVEGGASFASVAKKVSIDPVSKAKGGVLEGVAKGQEEKALDEAVFSAKTNVLSGPVKTPFGYYVFEVTKVFPGSQEPFSKVESAIKAQLTSQNQQQAMTKFVKEFRKKWTAKTECRAEYMVKDCKGYKEPKTTSTPTTTPSSSTSSTTSSTTSSSSAGKTK